MKTRIITILMMITCLFVNPAFSICANAETLPSKYKCFGDVNGNGTVDIGDVLMVRRHIAASKDAQTYEKHRDWILTGQAALFADVTRDNIISDADLLRIERHIAVINGGSSNQSWRIVTVYLDFGASVGRSGIQRCSCFSPSDSYNAHSNIERSILNDPKYTFIGWYTKPVGGTRVYGTSTVGTSNQILYAHYKLNTIPVTGIGLNKSSIKLTVGQSTKLTSSVRPSDATNKGVFWSSSNTKIVTVDSSGNVTAKKAGSATIKVTTRDGGYSAKATVTVISKSTAGAEAVYKKAKSQLGKKYPEFKGCGFHPHAWCADFVSWCAKKAGQSKAIPSNASVSGIRTAIKNAGGKEYSKSTIQKGNYTPKRGDIIIFKSNGASHVGIVDYAKNKKIYYIDGNHVSNGKNGNNSWVNYSTCSYSYSKLTCVLKPNYK